MIGFILREQAILGNMLSIYNGVSCGGFFLTILVSSGHADDGILWMISIFSIPGGPCAEYRTPGRSCSRLGFCSRAVDVQPHCHQENQIRHKSGFTIVLRRSIRNSLSSNFLRALSTVYRVHHPTMKLHFQKQCLV